MVPTKAGRFCEVLLLQFSTKQCYHGPHGWQLQSFWWERVICRARAVLIQKRRRAHNQREAEKRAPQRFARGNLTGGAVSKNLSYFVVI